MSMIRSLYPDNWEEIAFKKKETLMNYVNNQRMGM